MTHPTKPCAGCPFRRDIKPGYLGGSPLTCYVGQISGPFILACHMSSEYSSKPDESCLEMPQCAGAAIFRANVGVAEKMPKAFHRLPHDYASVFATFAEFFAHHTKTKVRWAEKYLQIFTPAYWLHREINDNRAISLKVKK